MNKKGMLVIISGPSGSGKGTVVKQLNRKDFALSISMTTRKPRAGELNGKDYLFCTKEEFVKIRESGGFLEHAEFVGNMYGTPKEYVKNQVNEGKAVILEIDVVGALQVKEKFEDSISIFLIPPSISDLYSRLKGRKTEDDATIIRRIKRAKSEIEYMQKYDYIVINDDINEAVQKLHTIIDSEYLKPSRNQNFINKILGDDFDVTTVLFGTNEQIERN
ncbi:MAG: guanylate kinase [Defluviitaleaceae bacterium]|nr:guanylate kinase [Defluviitaleaceae bacterium]